MASKAADSSGWILFASCVVFVWAFRAATSCGIQPPIIGYHRICSVVNESEGYGDSRKVQIAWHEKRCTTIRPYYTDTCPGKIGMNLHLECLAGSYICKEKECNSANTFITIPNLQPEDAGEYMCRTEDDVLFAFNVTVDTG